MSHMPLSSSITFPAESFSGPTFNILLNYTNINPNQQLLTKMLVCIPWNSIQLDTRLCCSVLSPYPVPQLKTPLPLVRFFISLTSFSTLHNFASTCFAATSAHSASITPDPLLHSELHRPTPSSSRLPGTGRYNFRNRTERRNTL